MIIPTPVVVGTTTYYTSEGQYYSQVSKQGETGYVKVSTPAGTEIATLPAGYKTIVADGKTYYVCNGTFYIKTKDQSSYIVVTPPFGIEVPDLPKDAVP